MIHVVIQEDGKVLGEMRIECLTPSSEVNNYSVEFAADSGGDWVDLKRRILYGFKSDRYNVLALVDAALSLLELNEMEKTVETTDSGRMARRQRGTRPEISHEATDPMRDHRSPLWRR